MSFEVIFKRGANLDLKEAIGYYYEVNKALSESFLSEVDKAIEKIKANSYLFQERYRNVRIVFTKRFPYGMHYTVEGSSFFVHAVFHTSRKPKK